MCSSISFSPLFCSVLAALGSAEVRDRLDPALATLSALELWNKYAAEVELAEISHGFPAVNDPTQNNALDLDIDIVRATC